MVLSRPVPYTKAALSTISLHLGINAVQERPALITSEWADLRGGQIYMDAMILTY